MNKEKPLIEEENNQKEKTLNVCYDVDEDFVCLYLGDEFISEFCFRLGKPKDFAKKISKCTKNKIKYEDVESGKFFFYENGKLIKE